MRRTAALTLDKNELAGINDFLEGLKDPIYKTRLKELEDKKKELETLIATAGKVKDIDRLNSKAQGLKDGLDILVKEAQDDREAAKQDATEIRTEAGKKASAKLDDANTQFAEREMDVVSAENELKQGEEELVKDRAAFDATITRTNAQMRSADIAFKKYHAATNAIREAIDRIAGTL